MDYPPFESRLEAYLAGRMSREERAAFEAELRSDQHKKRVFQTYYLSEMAERIRHPDELQEVARRLREQFGNLPKPSVSFWERCLEWFRTVWGKTALAGILFFAGLWTMANYGLPEQCSLVQTAMVEPYNGAVAGVSTHALSEVYFNQPTNALRQLGALADSCTGFCLERYYLAHAQLKAGMTADAADNFERLRPFRNLWPAVVEEEKVLWNLWLCGLCTDKTTVPGRTLDSFCDSPDESVQLRARALRDRLNHPLRLLRTR